MTTEEKLDQVRYTVQASRSLTLEAPADRGVDADLVAIETMASQINSLAGYWVLCATTEAKCVRQRLEELDFDAERLAAFDAIAA